MNELTKPMLLLLHIQFMRLIYVFQIETQELVHPERGTGPFTGLGDSGLN